MKNSGLPVFLRLDGRPVMLIGSGPAADAKRRLLERAGATLVGEDGQAPIALIATDDPEPIAARLKARGILLNVADRPDLCDFTLPAIIERDPVTIAIGTGGASAGLAAALRQRLEPLLPANLGSLALSLAKARDAIRLRWPNSRDRRRAMGAALIGPLDPLREQRDNAVETWLNAADQPADQLVQLRLTSRDPDDLTLRQARLLAQADCITHRADVPTAVLDRARADAERILSDSPPKSAQGLTIDVEMAG